MLGSPISEANTGFAPSGVVTGFAPSGINAGVVQKNPPQGGRFLVFTKAKVSALSIVPVSPHR